MKIKNFLQGKIFFFLLILLLIITRFLYIKDFFYFGVDEEYQALLGWSIVKNFHVLWIGVSASDTGYYLGPGLVYLSALLLWLNKDPLIFGYFASFIGVLTAISLYFITLKLYNFKTALISLYLYIFSPFAFYYDRKYWPLAVPLIALWLFYSLVKSFQNSRWLFLTAFLIGVSYHVHITLWLFWPLIIFEFTYLFIKKKVSLLTIFTSIGIFITITLPLLVFDFLHNFDNLLFPLRLLGRRNDIVSSGFLDRLANFASIFIKIFFPFQSPQLLNYLITSFLLTIPIFLILKQKLDGKKKFQITSYQLLIANCLLVCLLFLFLFSFIFFPSPMQEYYFVFIMPFIILITANILYLPSIKFIFLALFVVVNLYGFIKHPVYSDYKNKVETISKVKKIVGHKPFYLEIDGVYLYNGGWRYLFQSNNLKPNQSSADSTFGWIYPDEISKQKPKSKIIISKNPNLKLKYQLLKSFTSGIYTFYIQ